MSTLKFFIPESDKSENYASVQCEPGQPAFLGPDLTQLFPKSQSSGGVKAQAQRAASFDVGRSGFG